MLRKLGLIILSSSLAFYSCDEGSGQQDEHLIESPVVKKDSTGFGFTTDLTEEIAAYKTVVNIIRETGLAQNFVILPGDVENVKAYVEDNERVLEYNPDFMEKLQGDTNWPGLSVLARQIGHHLSNHELENGVPSVEEDIEADKYAGFVLFKMGASLDEAIKALEIAIGEDSIGKGISKNARLASLTKGWNNAKVLMTDTVVVAKAVEDTAVNEVVAEAKSIVKPDYAYRVFLALDKKMYFVDEEDKVFQEVNGKPVAVGLKKDSDKPGFDWIFMKEGDSYGVDLKGRLWAFSTDGNFHIVGQAVKLSVN